jgi:carbon monoxide dehydrogenase subunit G
VLVEGTREFAAPREDVFRALTDPQLLAEAIPLVRDVRVRDEDRWSAEVKVPLVARAPRLRLQFEILERRPPEHARLEAQGKSLGTSVRLATSFDLAEREGGTALAYRADLSLGGLLGRIPDSTLEPAARRAVDALLRAVERRVAR